MKLEKFRFDSKLYAIAEPNEQVLRKKNYSSRLSFIFGLLEFSLITVFFFYIYNWRISLEFKQDFSFFSSDIPRLGEYTLFYLLVMTINFIFIYRYKLYEVHQFSSFLEEFIKISKAYMYAILISVGISFFLKIIVYSRLVIIVFAVGSIFLSFITRAIRKLVVHRIYQKGDLLQKTLIIGGGAMAHSIFKELQGNGSLGISVVGIVANSKDEHIEGIPVISKNADLKQVIISNEIDDIIITTLEDRVYIEQLFQELRKYDVNFKIVPDTVNFISSHVEFGQIISLPYFSLIRTPMRGLNLVFKRVFDVVSASIIFLLLIPVFIVTATAIMLDSHGELIYKQERVGKNGRVFSMYKFRSMVKNAEKFQEELLSINEADGPVFKMKDDPRITKVGKFIRKYSIDELPQIFNVIKGDMSLVGPRPPLPKEVEQYSDREWRRMEVLPGITGMWQVSGRSNLRFQQWVDLDVYYIENWSFLLDIKILLRTIPAVLKGEGAY